MFSAYVSIYLCILNYKTYYKIVQEKLLEKENKGKVSTRGVNKAASKPRGGRVNPSDYPTYKRSSESAKSFRAAQRAAKAKGNKTFTWEGRRYNTTEK